MVNSLRSPFSPAQNLTLSLLGYQRWLPQELARTQNPPPDTDKTASLSFDQLAQSLREEAPPLITEEKTAPVIVNDDPEEEKSEDQAHNIPQSNALDAPQVLVLPNCALSVTICRDYVFLSSPNWACHWLLPPFWAREGNLQCFALPVEQKLWLSALEAVDFHGFSAGFAELFATQLPITEIADVPLAKVLEENDSSGKLLVICGEMAGVTIPENQANQHLLHPIAILNDLSRKKELWQQLLDLKETIF